MPRRAVAAVRVQGAGEALLRLACAAAWLAPLAAAAAPGCGEHGLVARAWKRPAQAGPQATPDTSAYPYPQVRHAIILWFMIICIPCPNAALRRLLSHFSGCERTS